VPLASSSEKPKANVCLRRQYIQPQDFHVLGQAELLVIDEAAAIPLPIVRSLLGPYLVFMASTINGYEGTGRSLSLKLLQQLREMSRPSSAISGPSGSSTTEGGEKKKEGISLARSLKEIKLTTPIRYGPGDPIEAWLNALLCLDATLSPSRSAKLQGCPHPSACELYYVNRDTLFSYHPASEVFLQRMMSLYVASHYKNSPNDLQLMSDAPGHALFVLLPPLKEGDNSLPEPLVVLQVRLCSLLWQLESVLTQSWCRSHWKAISRSRAYSRILIEGRWPVVTSFLGLCRSRCVGLTTRSWTA